MVFLISGSLVLTFVPWNHGATTIESEFVLGQALDLLCLPSLEKWTLHWRLFPLNTRISFIESSSFDLKPFQTIGDRDIPDRIYDLLRRFPSIEVLQLRFMSEDKPPTEILFFELLCSPSETASLPHLQTSKFDHDLLVPLESLLRILSASHHQSLGLRVDHQSISGIEDETAPGFLGIVDEGFDLRVLRDEHADMIEV